MRSFGSVAPPANMDDAFLSSGGTRSRSDVGRQLLRLPVWRSTSQGSRRLMVSAAWSTHDRIQ